MFFYYGNTMALGSAFAITQVLNMFREALERLSGILN